MRKDVKWLVWIVVVLFLCIWVWNITCELINYRRMSEKQEVYRVKVEEIEKALGHSGRILIRYSGTEPILRIMVEGEDEARLHKFAQEIVEEVRKHLS